jgi:HPr kinase/phosphorylase
MQVQLAVYLEAWAKDKKYDRLGSSDEVVHLGEVDIPQIKIPVKTGRNVAIIIEVAAMNFRAKTMGYDATQAFEDRLSQLIEENSAL